MIRAGGCTSFKWGFLDPSSRPRIWSAHDIVCSLRRDSFNRKPADAVVKLALPELSFKQVQIGNLPVYNQDDDANFPESVTWLKAEIAAALGPILFI